jgi:hypothetical protein
MKDVILAAVIMFAINTGISAQQKGNNPAPGTNKNQPGYVDNNNNGICDNYENRAQFGGRGQGRGNGNCNGNGPGMQKGQCVNRPGCMNRQALNMQCRRGNTAVKNT